MVCDESANGDYTSLLQGICISYYNNSSVHIRTKVRDTRHQQIKMLRGNDPKLEFHYFNLEIPGEGVPRVLPEHRPLFRVYKKLEEFTRSCTGTTRRAYSMVMPRRRDVGHDGSSVAPSSPRGSRFANVPFQYRTMLHELHTYYITTLRPNKERIRFELQTYVNQLHAAQLMFSQLRQAREKNIKRFFRLYTFFRSFIPFYIFLAVSSTVVI